MSKRVIIKVLNLVGVKNNVKELLFFINSKIRYFLISFSSYTLLKQSINYKNIPIIIISFNQLHYLKKLVEFLQLNGYKNIVIIDNNSTYAPLIEYLTSIEYKVTIHRLSENYGHLVFWKVKDLFEKYSKGFYVVTDSDIVPCEECPNDFLKYFKRVLIDNKIDNKDVTKVGFSLKIDDIPETNPNKQKVINWESQFWKDVKNDGNFKAPIDTTFALYRPNYCYDEKSFYDAMRTKKPYTAIHGGWYIDIKRLTEEQNNYFASCNESSSWKIDSQGQLFTKDYD